MSERSNGSTLAVLGGGNFAQLGLRLLLGALVPFILVEFQTSKSVIGLALTGMWAIYALFQFPSGILADRYGERRLLVVGLGGAVLGTLLVAIAPTPALFSLTVLVLGASTGLFFSPASTLTSRLFAEHGRAIAVITGTGAVAGVAYPALGGVIGEALSWRYALGLSVLVTGPVAAATFVVVPKLDPANPGRTLRAAFDFDRQREILTRPSVAYSVLLAMITAFFFQSTTSFLTTFLEEYRSIDPGTAGILFGVVLGLSSVAQPVAGWLSDVYSRDGAIATSISLAMLGLIILLAVPTQVGLAGGIVCLGLGISWPGAIQARLVDQFTERNRGYGFGLLRSVYMFLAASSSVIVGTLADVGDWPIAFGVVIALSIGGLVLLAANQVLSLDL